MPTVVRRTLFISVLVLAILACNLPVSTTSTPEPGAAFTSAAQTVAAAVGLAWVLLPPFNRIAAKLGSLGYLWIALDIEGFRTGSLNRAVAEGPAKGPR